MRFRVLSAQIAHETNTFSVKPTTLEEYRARAFHCGPAVRDAFQGTRTEIGAHIAAAEAFGWELAQPIACSATPSGRTSAEAWAVIRDRLFAGLGSEPFDGVLLALHGAMVVEGEDDAEGDLLRELRARLGDAVPIVVTVDLHANISDAMARFANAILAYRTYPHVDQFDISMEAAGLLDRAMRGEIRPKARVWRLPALDGCNHGRTGGGPMAELLALAESLRGRYPACLAAAICAGFPWADAFFTGPSVTVTWDGDGNGEAGPRAVAEPLLSRIWETRAETSVKLLEPAEAAARARDWQGPGPLVLADFTDNPGGGGYGDSVALLRALIEAGIPGVVFGTIVDPASVERCRAVGEGGSVALELGCKVDPRAYGPPLPVSGVVERLGDGNVRFDGPMMAGMRVSLGPTAVLRVGDVRIVVTSHNMQVFDQQIFKANGIDPAAARIVAVKSAHHFRSGFGPIAGGILLVDGGGLVSSRFERFSYRKLRRPVWPLDPVEDWRA